MEGIANSSSRTSQSQPPSTEGGYYPAPQNFQGGNQHVVYYGNIAAIQEQPTAIATTSRAVGDHYLTMSIALTVLSILFGTYGLICTIPAIIFSVMSHDAYKRGDVNTAVSYGRIALRLNIGAMVTWIVVFLTIISIYVTLFVVQSVSIKKE